MSSDPEEKVCNGSAVSVKMNPGDTAGRTKSCLVCSQAYDLKGRRKLTDACGHSRCLACIKTSDNCPFCMGEIGPAGEILRRKTGGPEVPVAHWKQRSDSALVAQQHSRRSVVRTNGHLAPFMRLNSQQHGKGNSDMSRSQVMNGRAGNGSLDGQDEFGCGQALDQGGSQRNLRPNYLTVQSGVAGPPLAGITPTSTNYSSLNSSLASLTPYGMGGIGAGYASSMCETPSVTSLLGVDEEGGTDTRLYPEGSGKGEEFPRMDGQSPPPSPAVAYTHLQERLSLLLHRHTEDSLLPAPHQTDSLPYNYSNGNNGKDYSDSSEGSHKPPARSGTSGKPPAGGSSSDSIVSSQSGGDVPSSSPETTPDATLVPENVAGATAAVQAATSRIEAERKAAAASRDVCDGSAAPRGKGSSSQIARRRSMDRGPRRPLLAQQRLTGPGAVYGSHGDVASLQGVSAGSSSNSLTKVEIRDNARGQSGRALSHHHHRSATFHTDTALASRLTAGSGRRPAGPIMGARVTKSLPRGLGLGDAAGCSPSPANSLTKLSASSSRSSLAARGQEFRPLGREVRDALGSLGLTPTVHGKHADSEPFIGREWLYREVLDEGGRAEPTCRGVVVHGGPGTGKTRALEEIQSLSAHGDGKGSIISNPEFLSIITKTADAIKSGISTMNHRAGLLGQGASGSGRSSPYSSGSASSSTASSTTDLSHSHGSYDALRAIARSTVACHFCRIEDATSCHVPEFVLNVAAQIATHPEMGAYRDALLREGPGKETETRLSLQARALTKESCARDPLSALRRGVLDPLDSLMRSGRVPKHNTLFIVVDSLDEAEFHKMDGRDSILSFIIRVCAVSPPWLRFIVSTKSPSLLTSLPTTFHRIGLNSTTHSGDLDRSANHIERDVREYVQLRMLTSRDGALKTAANEGGSAGGSEAKFCRHVVTQSAGSMLYAKLILSVVERGILALRAPAYRSLPVSFAQLFHLWASRAFTSTRAYEDCRPLLLAALATLRPLREIDLYEAVRAATGKDADTGAPPNEPPLSPASREMLGFSGRDSGVLTREEFERRLSKVSEHLAKRSDGTYGFKHASFRDWLLKREKKDGTKYQCDSREAHACLVQSLSAHIQTTATDFRPTPGSLEDDAEAQDVLDLAHHILKAKLYSQNNNGTSDKTMTIQGHQRRGPGGRSCDSAEFSLTSDALVLGSLPVHHRRGGSGISSDGNESVISQALSNASNGSGGDGGAGRDEARQFNAGLLSAAAPQHRLSAALACRYNVYYPNNRVSRLLLDAGADPDACTASFGRAHVLAMAIRQNHATLAGLLLQKGADINMVSEDGMTALCYAASRGHVDLVEQLLTAEAEVSPRDKKMYGPVVHAALGGKLAVLRLFASRLAKPSAAPSPSLVSPSSWVSSLVAAASRGHVDCMTFIWEKSPISIDDSDELFGETALSAASQSNQSRAIDWCVDRSANLTSGNRRGLTPLVCAARAGVWEAARVLLDTPASDVSTEEKGPEDGLTALGLAAARGDLEAVEMLLTRGASVTAEDHTGLTPLGLACLKGSVSVARRLVLAGSDLAHRNHSKQCLLHLAASSGNVELVQFLIDKDVSVEDEDSAELRPLDQALLQGHAGAARALLKRGAKLSPLTWLKATQSNSPAAMTKILLSKLMDDGNLLVRREKYDEALKRFKHAARRVPSNGDEKQGEQLEWTDVKHQLQILIGRCKRKTGDKEGAMAAYEAALQLKPTSYEAMYARGRARLEAHHVTNAVADLELAASYAAEIKEISSGEQASTAAAHLKEIKKMLGRAREMKVAPTETTL